jgi:hypothetical protein
MGKKNEMFEEFDSIRASGGRLSLIKEKPGSRSSSIRIYWSGSGMKLSVKAGDTRPQSIKLCGTTSNRINVQFRIL